MVSANLRVLRLPEVLSRVGVKRSTLYLMMGMGNFPKQVRLGERSVGWLESEVESWIERKIKASRSINKNKKLSGDHDAA